MRALTQYTIHACIHMVEDIKRMHLLSWHCTYNNVQVAGAVVPQHA